jgi:hypothetical protein
MTEAVSELQLLFHLKVCRNSYAYLLGTYVALKALKSYLNITGYTMFLI